ncbi:MAG: xylose isomerase, partial [Roseibacillus sp.]
CLNFLREYDLLDHLKLNVETNHAELAGHTMEHELDVAAAAGALGSIDANRGDTLIGWDTDQFPTNLYQTTNIMLRVLKLNGGQGFTTGGLNFDAKRRRESHLPEDLFHAHVGGMDAFARGLKTASRIIADGRFDEFVKIRYSSYDSGLGAEIEAGTTDLDTLDGYALGIEPPVLESGRQEMLENLLNDYI